MHKLKRLGKLLVEIDARYARIVHLAEKLSEVGAAFVPHPCLWKQATTTASLEYTYREINVLAKAHLRETFKLIVHIAAHTHVERARIELVELLLAASYASGGEERGHGIGYRLLSVGERRMSAVGPSESIGRFDSKFLVHSIKITLGHHNIRIEN